MDPKPLQEHEERTPVREFFHDIKTFWDRFGLSVLVVVLAILVVMLLSRYLSGREQRALEAAYSDLATAQSPFEMVDVANRYEHMPAFSGYALLEAAGVTLNEALGLQFSLTAAQLSEEDKAKALDRAAELFNRVVKLNASPLQVLNARMGIAAVLESQGKFEEAASQYETIRKEAGEGYAVIGQRAQNRAKDLEKLKVAVHFPAPKEPAPEAKPGTELDLKPPELLPAPQTPAQPEAEKAP